MRGGATLISEPVRLETYIGRSRERAFVHERLRAASSGEGSVVVLTGTAGLGKSRLLSETAAHAAPLGLANVVVAIPAYAAGAHAVPYAVVERLAATGALDPAVAATFARALAGGEGAPALHALAPIALDAIVAAGVLRPLAIVVDDAHSCDEAGLAFVEALAKRCSHAAICLVVTLRAEERAARPGLAAFAARLESGPCNYAVRLAPLPSAELGGAMLEATRGRRALVPRVRDDILRRAGGNPFHVEELLRAYVDGEDVPRAPTAIAAVVDRFVRVSAAARRVARAAAILGQRFELALLETLVPLDADERYDALRELRDAALVSFDGGIGVFEHAIAREAVLTTLLDDEARTLHAAVAGRLAERGADVVDRAHHAVAASTTDAPALAEAAGDALMTRLAADEAARFYRAALASAADADARARLLEKTTAAHERLSELASTAGFLEEAVAIHERAGRFDAALHDTIEIGRLAHNVGAFANVDAALRSARTLFPRVSLARRYRACVTFALILAMEGRTGAAAALAREAEAERPDDPETYRFSRMRALVRAVNGDARWRADAADAVAAVAPLGICVARYSTYSILTESALSVLDFASASAFADESIAAARALGSADMLHAGLTTGAHPRLHEGRLAEAAAMLDEALDACAERPNGASATLELALLAGIALRDDALVARVDLDALRELVRRPLAPSSAGPKVHALSELYERDGRTSLNRALLDAFANTVDDAHGAWTPLARAARFGTGSAPARARRLLEASVATAPSPWTHGHLALSLAYEASRGKRPALARKHGTAAAEHFRAAGAPFLEARAWEAACRRDAALALYETCGAAYDVARLRAAMSRNAELVPARISSREREIALALREGTSATDIAAALFLSPRTVESHVASLYRKLGVRNRAAFRNAVEADPALLDP